MQHWHQLETSVVLRQHGTDAIQGLSTAEAVRRMIQHGPNELVERGAKAPG